MIKLLAFVILAYTAVMLAIHVASWKLVNAWYDARATWGGRVLTPIRVLRLEAAYWTIATAAWPLWHSVRLKVLVAVFAAIHLASWVGGEVNRKRIDSSLASGHSPRYLALVVTVFDLVEALALSTLGWTAASVALRP